jgi:pyruvate formate lyase activating enzyme
MVLTTYGRSSGFCIDPIEKKPLAHFLPGTPVLSFGTAGCNLACRFCQNWEISASRDIDLLAEAASPGDIAAAAARSDCPSVAFTYNDPVVFLEYAIDVATACRSRGIRTVAVTAGYLCAEPRAEFFDHIDAANIDLKFFDDDSYRRLARGSLQPVLETIEYAHHETPVWVELTTLVIPGHNDGDDELTSLSRWIVERLDPEVPLHLSAFHPDHLMADVPPTPPATLRRARQIAIDAGLHHVYLGNIRDPEGSATRCLDCGTVVIGRTGYSITEYRLNDRGRCRECGTQIPGVFDGPVGSWGGRRMPVRMGAR